MNLVLCRINIIFIFKKEKLSNRCCIQEVECIIQLFDKELFKKLYRLMVLLQFSAFPDNGKGRSEI